MFTFQRALTVETLDRYRQQNTNIHNLESLQEASTVSPISRFQVIIIATFYLFRLMVI